jgi:tetratricopeptide (TPR) repeat protein
VIRRSFNLGGIIRCVAWLLAGLAAWTVPTDVSASIGIERVALLAEGAAAPPADFRAARWRAGGQSGDIDGYADWFLLTLTRGDAELSTGAGPEARSWTWLAHAHGVTIAADATARPLDALLLELEQTVYDRAGLNAAAARAAALELDPAERRLVDLAWQRAAWRSRLGDLVLDHAAKPSPPLDDAVEAALAVVHAFALIEAGQAAAAVPLVDAVLSFNDLPAAPRVATIEARLLAVRLAQAQGEHARAVERVDQARDIARRLGGASQWLARVEFSAGQVASATDRRPEALVHQETARALALRYPGDHLDSVSILQAYSSALYRLGRFDESAQAQAAAAAMLGRIDAPVAVRASVSAWGATMLWRANRSREAIAEFRAVLALLDAEQLDNSTATAVRQNLATLLFERGDLAAAARLFDQALRGEHRLRPGTLDEVRVLVNAARNDDQLGRDELAADRYARADAILAKIAPTAQLRAYLASNWAEHLARMGQVDAARVRFEEAVGIARELDRDCYCAGPSLRDYAVFAADQGRHDEALRLLDEARAVLVQFDNGAAEQWSIDVQRADVLRRAGRAADAADLVAEPLASIARALPNTPLHAVALYTAGRIADAQGDATAARTSHCAAADVLDRIDVAREAPGLAAERFRARHADVYRACLDHMVDAGDADAAFRQFERLRVRSIAAEQSSRRLEYSGERDAVDRWRASIERLADVEERVRDPETGTVEASDSRSALTAARNDVDAARTVLRNEAPRAARWLVPELRTPVGLRTAMPADVLYVGWSVGEANTLLFVSGRDVEPRVVRLRVGRPELTAAVTRLRERILRRDPADLPAIREEAAALREMLFGTHVDLVARHPRLWLAADGPLLSLPFAALYDADRGRWLIEDHDIAVVDSLHLALPGSTLNHASTRWLVVADADSGDAERVALPAARREATAVAQAATAAGGEPALLVGAAATEAMVKRRAGNAGRLHFAVHSEVDAERPLESALLLGGGDGDDGALHVWEVYEQLALDADLVVLSSCSSALGRELRGQGLLGLARAFRHAGARRVVASLWPVEDSGTDVLMRRFYAHLTQGRPDAALRIAVVEQLGGPVVADASTTRGVGGLTTEPAPQVRLDHPYYWAGFQVY